MSATDRIFCHFGLFLPFYPHNNSKNQNFKKLKKIIGDIIILHRCTINEDHMMYGSWDMEHNGQTFLSFWTVFCIFTPLTIWKIKILKKWKDAWKYYHFTYMYHKWQSYDVCFLRYGRCQTEFFCHFGLFFALLPP